MLCGTVWAASGTDSRGREWTEKIAFTTAETGVWSYEDGHPRSDISYRFDYVCGRNCGSDYGRNCDPNCDRNRASNGGRNDDPNCGRNDASSGALNPGRNCGPNRTTNCAQNFDGGSVTISLERGTVGGTIEGDELILDGFRCTFRKV